MTLRRLGAMLAVTLPVVAGAAPAPAAAPKPRIVGGTSAAHQWPAQALLQISRSDGEFMCGGTLVSPRWVITAAHCVSDTDNSIVAPGTMLVTLGSNSRGSGDAHTVSRIERIKEWNAVTGGYDAALIKLAEPASQPPLALLSAAESAYQEPGKMARVIGWGATDEFALPSNTLQQADVAIQTDADCNDANSYNGMLDGLADVTLCAGYPNGGIDACQGDSGGPLMGYTGLESTGAPGETLEGWKLIGIVSAGEGCARPGKYGVYTQLMNAQIRAWIAKTIDGFPTGLQNASFELNLSGELDWSAAVLDQDGDTLRSGVNACPNSPPESDARRRVCAVMTDTFPVTDGGGTRQITVKPLDGTAMLRLGGPFRDASDFQARDRYVASQAFTVTAAQPVIQLNYNTFSFGGPDADLLRFRVRMFDADRAIVAEQMVAPAGGGSALASSGWRSVSLDLKKAVGKAVTLRIEAGGTRDNRAPFWAYIDSGDPANAPPPPPPAPVPPPPGPAPPPPPPPPPPAPPGPPTPPTARPTPRFAAHFQVDNRRLRSLRLTGIRRGSTVRVTCVRGCSGRRLLVRRAAVRPHAGAIRISLLHPLRLAGRMLLLIRVTDPSATAGRFEYHQVRRGTSGLVVRRADGGCDARAC